jgi:hypothetical protein
MSIDDQAGQLQRYLPLFVYPAHKQIRTRIVDALWRTNDATRSGNEPGIRRTMRLNKQLLRECRDALADMPSGIWNEVKQGLGEVTR